jgi:hypothetical protein
MATSMWREATDDPLPKMEPAAPEQQIQDFELRVVELVFREATAETAKRTADQTWDLVHDRPDDDPVKQRVVKGHEALARLSAESVPPADE